MEKVSVILLFIMGLFFACGSRQEIQTVRQELPATTPPPPTLEELARLPASQRAQEDRIATDIDALIFFGSNNQTRVSTSEDKYTITGRVIPSATRLEVLKDNEALFSQDFSGTGAPHPFTVDLALANNQLAEGRNEYIFRLYKNSDTLDTIFIIDRLPRSQADVK